MNLDNIYNRNGKEIEIERQVKSILSFDLEKESKIERTSFQKVDDEGRRAYPHFNGCHGFESYFNDKTK